MFLHIHVVSRAGCLGFDECGRWAVRFFHASFTFVTMEKGILFIINEIFE